jgi:acyl-CoA thioester hydrolase
MQIKPLEIQVRFADLDVLGHVNNAIYLSYFEMARVHYFKELLGESWDWKKNGLLLVRNEVDYLAPIFLHQKPLISMYLVDIGNKSFKLRYEIHIENKLHTIGFSTLVCFDATKNITVSIPIEWKLSLEKLKKIK